jgi:hypothetical protein
MSATDIRVQMLRNGFSPVPLAGKRCYLKDWDTKTGASATEIGSWASVRPDWTNTGALTRLMPTLDLDILNQEAACIAEDIVRRRYEGHGLILVRIGRPPKRAVPFRTDEPFKKIVVVLTGPNGGEEKAEFLGDGQQLAVAGVHPDTGEPYRWHGGELWQTARNELPYVREMEARAVIDEIVGMLVSEFGYRRKAGNGKQQETYTHHVSLMGGKPSRQADHEIPKPLYELVHKLMPDSRGIERRRVIGVLRPLVRMREGEGRNRALLDKAICFRKELIREGVVTEEVAAELLLMAARINRYVEQDGEGEARRTIRSGLSYDH